jgi:hypothetical protein
MSARPELWLHFPDGTQEPVCGVTLAAATGYLRCETNAITLLWAVESAAERVSHRIQAEPVLPSLAPTTTDGEPGATEGPEECVFGGCDGECHSFGCVERMRDKAAAVCEAWKERGL